ncbi:MAG: AzlD domain-containing protein [Thermaerobacterales bacterium]
MELSIWWLIAAMSLITFSLRLVFIGLEGRLAMPEWALRMLRFVPAAVLPALIVPALVMPAGTVDFSLQNQHLVSGIIAAAVAWRTHNVVLTIVAGVSALWLLERLAGG